MPAEELSRSSDTTKGSVVFQIISDVHLGRRRQSFPITPWAPHLLICGDIGNITKNQHLIEAFLCDCATKFETVVWILGNHEHFSIAPLPYRDLVRTAERIAERTGTVFLHNSACDVAPGVRVLGTPLYTSMPVPDKVFQSIRSTDARYIWRGHGHRVARISAADFARMHRRAKRFLAAELRACRAAGARAIVLTHYAPFIPFSGAFNPTKRFPHRKWLHGIYNTAADMAEVMAECEGTLALWAFGHSHKACRKRVCVGATAFPVVSNPVGHVTQSPRAVGFRMKCAVALAPRD